MADAGSGWSWSWWLVIETSPLPPLTANGVGYDASRMASFRDPSWHPFSSTTTPLTCQPPSPESMPTPTPSNHACWWRLTNSGRGAEPRHGNRRWIPPDLEAKAQSTTKAVLEVFHLDNKEAKRDLKVNHNNETVPFCSEPTAPDTSG